MSLTYVYCVVRSTRQPSLDGVPGAMPGGDAIRALKAGDGIWLIVSDVPARRYDEAALAGGLTDLDWVGRRAMAHEKVVEHFLGARSVLPMQMFTLFTSDERAVRHVTRDRRQLARVLSRIERQLEWGLRLTLDEKSATDTAARTTPSRRHSPRAETGADYLSRKRDLIGASRRRLAQARADGNRLYRALAREATAALRRTSTERAAPGSRLLLDAAFLVPVRRAGAFRTALRRQAKQLAPGVVVSLTGPWPPYNFIGRRSRARRA